MKVHTTKSSIITILCLVAFIMMSSVCSAQEWSRSGKKEIYGVFQTMSGYSEDATIFGTPVEAGIDDATAYGFGLGYNIDDHWNVNTDFLFSSLDAYIKIGPSKSTDSGDMFLWDVNLDYNVFEDRLTPFVSGGIGLALIESTSEFAFNLGAGARWDITDNIFLKAMYRMTWIDEWDSDGVMVGVGYMF